MAFQERQFEGVYQSVEVSTGTVAPGALATATPVNVQVTLSSNGSASGAQIGDIVDAVPPASAAPLGVNWLCQITSAGVASLTFINATGASITPVSSVWTFWIRRIVNAGV